MPTIVDLTRQLTQLTTTHPEVDAHLLAELARSYATDPVGGALPFATLIAPYFLGGKGSRVNTTMSAGCAGQPDAPAASAAELEEVLGDRRMSEAPRRRGTTAASGVLSTADSLGQTYGLAETLALYRTSDQDAVLSAWYQSRARQHIRPLRELVPVPETTASIPGPLETWELGDDVADIDWAGTLSANPLVIPGVTTRTRSHLPDDPTIRPRSVELDLYLDSSGSMRHPERDSPAVLAGTITALSVLAAGGHVRVTSFSDSGMVSGTDGFTRHRASVMAGLTTFHGGGTVFPLDLLSRRFPGAPVTGARSTHLLVLSDDGLASMFGAGQQVYAGVAARVRPLLATATLVLIGARSSVDSTATEAGYTVEHVSAPEDTPAVCTRLARRITGTEAADVR
ncbi:hypothetical protein AAFP35_00610 [Gordonia sp. CPCC 206044]|uniref:hypothetical protein n=1 Tax=Gordonia sp. CPCC 206044 TaxID=3140793 RepID=UPI003AF33441